MRRSYTLLELANGTIPVALQPRDDFEAALLEKLAEQRSELNWFYHQLNRMPMGDEPLSDAAVAQLRQAANRREQEIATIVRQLRQRSDEEAQWSGDRQYSSRTWTGVCMNCSGDWPATPSWSSTIRLRDRLLAFVVTGRCDRRSSRSCSPLSQVEHTVHQLRFQIDTLRHGGAHVSRT